MKNESLTEAEKKKLVDIRKRFYEVMVQYDTVFRINGRDYLSNTPSKDRFNEIRDVIVEEVITLLPLIAPYSVTLGYVANMHMGLINLVENILYGIDLKYLDRKETLDEVIARDSNTIKQVQAQKVSVTNS